MSLTGQAIRIKGAETGIVSEFVLCKVNSVGCLEIPNEDAKFLAVLRDLETFREGQKVTHEYRCVVPYEFEDAILHAFRNGSYLLAEIQRDYYLSSLIEIPNFERLDVQAYERKHPKIL